MEIIGMPSTATCCCDLQGRSKGAPLQLRLEGTSTHAAGSRNDQLQDSTSTVFNDQHTSRPGKRRRYKQSALPAASSSSALATPEPSADTGYIFAPIIVVYATSYPRQILPSKVRGAAQESSGDRIRKDGDAVLRPLNVAHHGPTVL